MSNILNRLKNLESERPSVLRAADPVVSRSQRSSKGNKRKRLILFVAIIISLAFGAAYQFRSHFLPAQPIVAEPVVTASLIENQKNELAVASYKLGEFSKSVEMLEGLVKAQPKRADFHVNLAMAYQQLSKFDKAQEHLQIAISLDPKESYAHNNLGLLAQQTKNSKLAEKSFEKAYELNPQSPEIVLNLASFYEKSNQLQKSVMAYQKYVALPKADQKIVELVKKRIPRLNSLSVQPELAEEEEGT